MSGPAIGEPDPERAAPARTGFAGAASGILVLLAVGLILRLIIAYLIPGSGFKNDLGAFSFWASNLAASTPAEVDPSKPPQTRAQPRSPEAWNTVNNVYRKGS